MRPAIVKIKVLFAGVQVEGRACGHSIQRLAPKRIDAVRVAGLRGGCCFPFSDVCAPVADPAYQVADLCSSPSPQPNGCSTRSFAGTDGYKGGDTILPCAVARPFVLDVSRFWTQPDSGGGRTGFGADDGGGEETPRATRRRGRPPKSPAQPERKRPPRARGRPPSTKEARPKPARAQRKPVPPGTPPAPGFAPDNASAASTEGAEPAVSGAVSEFLSPGSFRPSRPRGRPAGTRASGPRQAERGNSTLARLAKGLRNGAGGSAGGRGSAEWPVAWRLERRLT